MDKKEALRLMRTIQSEISDHGLKVQALTAEGWVDQSILPELKHLGNGIWTVGNTKRRFCSYEDAELYAKLMMEGR